MASLTDSKVSRDAFTTKDKSSVARNFIVLWGIAAMGDTLSWLGKSVAMSCHLAKFAKPCLTI